MVTLTLDERDRRWNNVREAMKKQGLECLIVFGSNAFLRNVAANLRYLSFNVLTDGYLLFPLEDEPTLFTFLKTIDPTAWVPDRRSGHPNYSEVMSERIRELHLESAKIGLVGLSGYMGELGFPHTTYVSLTDNLPEASFEDATELLVKARMIKSDAEIRVLEAGCEVGLKVIQAIVDTARVGVKDYEVRLEVMKALFMGGCEPDALLLYYSGTEIVHGGQGGWAQPPGEKVLNTGQVILIEFDVKYLGYRAQFNQVFSVGEPSQELKDMFSTAVESFNNAFQTLRPGITVEDLKNAFLSPIKEAGYSARRPSFHGLGLTGIEEPIPDFPDHPGFKQDNSLKMEAGTVIEFEPQFTTPDGKRGIHLGCPVLVTETGCRLLSKNWKPELKIV